MLGEGAFEDSCLYVDALVRIAALSPTHMKRGHLGEFLSNVQHPDKLVNGERKSWMWLLWLVLPLWRLSMNNAIKLGSETKMHSRKTGSVRAWLVIRPVMDRQRLIIYIHLALGEYLKEVMVIHLWECPVHQWGLSFIQRYCCAKAIMHARRFSMYLSGVIATAHTVVNAHKASIERRWSRWPEDYHVLVFALAPRAYISCESEGCDERLIGLCLAATSCLDDDKRLTCMYTHLDTDTNTHTQKNDQQSQHNTSVTCNYSVLVHQLNVGFFNVCIGWDQAFLLVLV